MRRCSVVAALLAAVFLQPVATEAAPPAPAPLTRNRDVDVATRPFAPTSPWNTRIRAHAHFGTPGSDPCSQQVARSPLGTDVNAGQYSHPVYVATDADPTWTIKRGARVLARIKAPSDITPARPSIAEGGDAHLHVIDPTHAYVDEMWRARVDRPARTITVASHTRNSLSGLGVGRGGERAYGGSAIGGLIRTAELRVGRIDHALALALPRSAQKLGPVWPATQQDDGAESTYLGAVPMGTLVAIPPTVDLASLGLSPRAMTVARALQQYGAYDVDSSSDMSLYAEPSAESLVDPVRAALRRIRPLLRCVLDNVPPAPGRATHR